MHSLLAAGVPVTRRQFPSLAAAGDTNSAPVKYTVNVSNTGAVDADDVVLGFLEPPGKAGSHCRFALPLVRFIPDLLTCSVHFFLKQQCDRTLPTGAGVSGVPRQILFDFQRVFVKAGETLALDVRKSF